ncbi:WD domain-containing protein, G-beta repeat-containing protein [Parafrankia irregularis]|uniref:WD domain-containing protein, G-beta repeat-containing protein n=1 Tax=Parafrankia irregularis TaxID=795642 RepID=A0A0S4QYI7_9ACTN|nr:MULTISPECIES: serine/threonine-protein kinase [Parafrankia]MBE3200437.1 serine/threonine protein kinase [Parafrankia sp. CH37]CUU60699.1 WD domain-containing protein, G-beta repeat-containing protein [Parafrankia irregularis]
MLFDRARVAATLPGYDLGNEIGAGSFGLVLAGWHRNLQREVAIKVLAPGGRRRPFGADEAQIMASLDHPHIVRVHDFRPGDDFDVIVMEMLAGGSLSRRQREMGQEEFCAVGLAVAGALSYAHSRGVLHRDIKPDNVMFDFAGHVKVVDFGIAKRVFGSAATASAVIGTPLFMAPEQVARGRLGPATDLYALGMMLFLLLAGKAPFDGEWSDEVFGEPHLARPGHSIRRPAGIPPSVADVILRALAKDPGGRPPSAKAFAVDLAEAAADSYGPGWLGRSGIRVHLDDDVRAAAEARSVLPIAVAAATIPRTIDPGGPTAPAPNPSRSARSGQQQQQSRSHRRSTRPRFRRRGVAAAGVLLLSAVAALLFATISRGAGDTRPHQVGLLAGHTDWVTAVAFSPNGRTLASGGRDRAVRLWDVSDPFHPHQLGSPLLGHTDGITSVAFSPDGRTLVSAGKDSAVRRWDVTDPSRAHSLGAPLPVAAGYAHAVAFPSSAGRSLDGRVMASGGAAGMVQLWDLTDRAAPRPFGQPLAAHHDRVWSVALSSEGRTLASGSLDGTVRLWDVTDPALPHSLGAPLDGHPGGVYTVAFAPDTRTLASGGKDGLVRLWEVTDPASPRPLGHPLAGHSSLVWSVAFSPDERTLASVSADQTVRLWDVTDRTSPRPLGQPLVGHTDWVTSVAFSPNGRIVASGSWDKTVRLWAVP